MLSDEEYTDKELLLSISEGDERAFSILFERYYPRLRPFIFRFIPDPGRLEDALQETFIRAWLYRDQLNEIENIGAWLRTVASRICLTTIRKNLVRDKHTEAYSSQNLKEESAPVDKATFTELKKLVAEAVDNMPPARKNIYLLSRNEDMKPAEIARELSLSVNTVRNVLVIALKEIREYLKSHGYMLSIIYIFIYLKL